jgi:hypothetical protein
VQFRKRRRGGRVGKHHVISYVIKPKVAGKWGGRVGKRQELLE